MSHFRLRGLGENRAHPDQGTGQGKYMGKREAEGKGTGKSKGPRLCDGNDNDWEEVWAYVEEIQAKLAQQGWLREGERDYMEMQLRMWEEEGWEERKGRGKWKATSDLRENRGRLARVRAKRRARAKALVCYGLRSIKYRRSWHNRGG